MAEKKQLRMYGGWTMPRSEGLFGLTAPVTVAFFVWVILVVLLGGVVSWFVAGPVAIAGIIGGVLLVLKPQGRPVSEWIGLRMEFKRAKRKGLSKYLSGPFSRVPGGRYALPGVLGRLEVSEHYTGGNQPFAMLHDPQRSEYTVVFGIWPQGDQLVDSDVMDSWVDQWGAFLSNLGAEGDVVAATAVVETFPSTGMKVRQEVRSITKLDAPVFAQQVMVEAAEMHSSQRIELEARLSITFKATTSEKRRDVSAQAKDLAVRLPLLQSQIEYAGQNTRPLAIDDLVTVAKRAYSSSLHPEIEALSATSRGHEIEWADAGPSQAEQTPNYYVHDGSVSSTWEMVIPPRGYVPHRVLRGLLMKDIDLSTKRVAVCYRPHTAAEAAKLVDSDAINKRERTKQERGRRGSASARAEQDEASAEQARQAEALGHGLTRFGLLVTVTEPAQDLDESGHMTVDKMPNAEAILKSLSQRSRIQLRRRYCSQQLSFAAALGLGINIPEHLSAAALVQG